MRLCEAIYVFVEYSMRLSFYLVNECVYKRTNHREYGRSLWFVCRAAPVKPIKYMKYMRLDRRSKWNICFVFLTRPCGRTWSEMFFFRSLSFRWNYSNKSHCSCICDNHLKRFVFVWNDRFGTRARKYEIIYIFCCQNPQKRYVLLMVLYTV